MTNNVMYLLLVFSSDDTCTRMLVDIIASFDLLG